MKKFICRLLSAFLATATVLSLGVTAFAVESSEENEDVTIVQVLVVSDNGCYLYEGEDAQAAFLEIKDGSFVVSSLNEIDSFPVVTDAAKVLPVLNEPGIAPNSLTYKYRFLPSENNKEKVYGSYSIISDPWGNATSAVQKSTIAFTATASGSMDCSLSGKYLDVVEEKIGTQYKEEFSATVSVDYNVPSHKRVWLQYKPEYTHYVGYAQKYYITRYSDQLIVETSKKVDILEASERTVSMLGSRYTLPAGTYVWCQDSDYMSKNPPKVQN